MSEAKEYKGDPNNTNVLSYKQKFEFDRFGNLYRKNASNPTAGQENPLPFTPIENADIDKNTNRFTSVSGTTYNDAGQVVTDSKFRAMSFGYDANGRMVKATKANVPDALSVYDALGNRVATKVNDLWQFVIYDAFGKLVAEYGGMNSTDEGGVKYVLQDWQGSVRASVSNSGYVKSRTDYQAFGEEIQSGVGLRTAAQGFGGGISTRQGYGLTEKDDSTGLNHTWFRQNENRAGRWTSPDPYDASMSLGNPQSFNRYSYVENEPTNFVDPSGLLMRVYRCERVCTTFNHPDGEPETYCETNCHWEYYFYSGGGGNGQPPIDGGGGGGGGTNLIPGHVVGACSLVSGLEHAPKINWWKSSKNGKWYQGVSGRGPNQFTGARSTAAFNSVNAFKVLSRGAFAVGTGITVYQVAFGKANPGKGASDFIFSFVGTFGGPAGWVVGSVYFLADYAGLVDAFFDLKPTARAVNTNLCHMNQ